MENADEEDDLKLIKASAGLLTDLEHDLPRLLFKPGVRRAHTRVKKRDLDRVVNLIEPFQGEPQLLDAKLKIVLPPIVDAYLEFLSRMNAGEKTEYIDLETAICTLIYTLCKVRGQKVIVGCLNNEPRYLEPVLEALERTVSRDDTQQTAWKVPYALLLWLSHLLLTPFDLVSVSDKPAKKQPTLPVKLPHLATRVLNVGLSYLATPTKAQDAAAAMLVRLSIRPDIQKHGLADALVQEQLWNLSRNASEMADMYQMLGDLRLVAGVAASTELSHLVPDIYRTCERVFDENDDSSLSSNAVAKKIIVKIFRNVAILALRSVSSQGPLRSFLETTDVLENVIDYLLRSLGDKDTPVRYAAAKALSLIILELDPEMGHEVVQAIIESFKEDLPRSHQAIDFTTANPLKWHGLTLALAHTLFKRSASPDQLPDILDALIAALQFQQRTATGTTLGTNVRDAANFGIWSLSRRYTTSELSSVTASSLHSGNRVTPDDTIIDVLAIQLILSSCLDPAGNIRRGSSAALQELVGRHPNQVHEGISLVQIVDYQAVSLRNRAMIDVAKNAAALHPSYWQGLFIALFGWRGLGSADVLSRQAAAGSLARLDLIAPPSRESQVLQSVLERIETCPTNEVESMHGLALSLALIVEGLTKSGAWTAGPTKADLSQTLWPLTQFASALSEFSPRMLRSEFPASLAQLTTALSDACFEALQNEAPTLEGKVIPHDSIESITDKLLYRREEWIIQVVPDLVKSVLRLKRAAGQPLGCVGASALADKVSVDGAKSTLHSVGRAIALGALASTYDSVGLVGAKASRSIDTLCGLLTAMNVDWRIIGARALQLAVGGISSDQGVDESIVHATCAAIHTGLNDYTVDERGDIGSLVRLQSLSCATALLASPAFSNRVTALQIIKGDIYRLSLEKLDRVRLQAAQCRQRFLDLESDLRLIDVASVSSQEYFAAALSPLSSPSTPEWTQLALLEGTTLCAGIAAESLLVASRSALLTHLHTMDASHLTHLLTLYTTILKTLLLATPATQPALELLSFLLDMHIPQRLADPSSTFKWRNLLSVVQKSHHKSNDIPKILAAVRVYVGLSEVESIREEVLKKVLGMLKTNPYPRVRVAVAEALWVVTGEEALKGVDWTGAVGRNGEVLEGLQKRWIGIGT
ncbi:hypothetical protein PRZ48_014648 [Zasmidium cellare]|uniref:Tubulin-specific chaperone D C-terminal domain-containing protein n=1 Tax=Zasmidium cellare TaxID=395010 RepID=A0ABR0DZB4_ZASCE|nr:hypothetical protein PRZ48_014648 [Zasmidium cellare]